MLLTFLPITNFSVQGGCWRVQIIESSSAFDLKGTDARRHFKGKGGSFFFRVRTAVDGSTFLKIAEQMNSYGNTRSHESLGMWGKISCSSAISAVLLHSYISTCRIHLSIIYISPSARCIEFINILKNRSFS